MYNGQQKATYGEQYNISPYYYNHISIAELPFSVRTINALIHANIKTVEQLLYKTEAEISEIKNIGSKCLEEIKEYVLSIDSSRLFIAQNNSVRIDIPIIFKENIDAIVHGNFSIFSGLSDDEKVALEKFKEAHQFLDTELIERCCYLPETVVPIINMFNQFIYENDKNTERLKHLNELVDLLPGAIKEASLLSVLNISATTQITIVAEKINKQISIDDYVSNLVQISNDEYCQLVEVLQWCNFDIKHELSELYRLIYKKSNMETVVKMRSNGNTLEETGIELGVTRERVRQIEQKAKRIFAQWNRGSKVLNKVSLLCGGDVVLAQNELEDFFCEHTPQMIWFLKDSEGDYIYDKQLNMFIAGGEELSSRGQLFLDSLPDVFHKNILQGFLKVAQTEWELPTEAVEKAVKENYNLTGNTYHRTRLSLTSMYDETLKKFYISGLHIYDPEELRVFRERVKELFGDVKLPQNNRALSARIADICILCGRGKYMPKQKEYLPKELTDRIYKFICESNSSIFLMNTLYSIFEDELICFGVDNKYFLQGILRSLFEDEFVFSRDYISKSGNVTTIHSEIVNFIKQSQYPVTKTEIQAEFPGVTDILISFAVSEPEVLNYFGEYLHANKLSVSKGEKEWLRITTSNILSDNKAHHAKEMFDFINIERPEILSRNGATFQFSLYSILEHLFNGMFQFSRPYISNLGVNIDRPGEVLHDLIYSEDEIIISEITSFAKENRFQIPSILDFLNNCNDNYLIVDSKKLASFDYIKINQDSALEIENILLQSVKKTMPIKDLDRISLLPPLNVPWTDWLVYSVINKWGTRLEVNTSSNQFRMAFPLISPIGEMNVDAFKDVVITENEVLITPDDLDDIDNLIADIIEDELLEVDL